MDRLSELRCLVSQIASDVGLDAAETTLDGDVAALGRRLEDVRETLTALADVAERRAEDQANTEADVLQARQYLDSVQKVRTPH